MVTIKDIAKAAGVAQGTVSNVLNGRGNVSSEKIRHVLEVCEALGYVPNKRAKMLRKGHTNVLGVIISHSHTKCYSDFFQSFKAYAEGHGYTVRQYIPRQETPEAEEEALQEAREDMAVGIAVFSSCLHFKGQHPYQMEAGALPMETLFVERQPDFDCHSVGFDYGKAGQDMAQKAVDGHYSSLCLLTGGLHLSHEAAFYHGFMRGMEGRDCTITHIQTDELRKYQNVLQAFDCPKYQALFASNIEFAEAAKNILNTFFGQSLPDIYTVSPMFTMPEMDFQKYELNFRLLGNTVAQRLIRQIREKTPPTRLCLENAGFRNWFPPQVTVQAAPRPINVLTLDSPTAYTMRSMSRLYTKHTGIPVNITIYSYNEVYEAFNNLRKDSIFDVLRLDVTWLSWFAEKILYPLEEIDPQIAGSLSGFLPGALEQYSFVNNAVYALPSTPSTQMLFYRRDLFQSAIWRRMYQEKYKAELAVPTDFAEFNRIAVFFSKAMNPDSPVEFGATLTLGSTGVAGAEYLARLFALQEHLYDAGGDIRLDSPRAVLALEQLIELKRYSNPRHCSWWNNTAADFGGGNVAMAILYYNFASGILSHESRVAGNIGYAPVPGGNPVIGGGSLGISRFSQQPEQALHFIRWVCSEPIASASTLLGGVSPCNQSYDNYEIINTFPWLKLAKRCFSTAKGRRMPVSCTVPFDERRFMSIIGMAVKNAYSGAQPAKEAMAYAQKLFEEQFVANIAACKQ